MATISIHRIGRRPDPWQYPDWSRANPDERLGTDSTIRTEITASCSPRLCAWAAFLRRSLAFGLMSRSTPNCRQSRAKMISFQWESSRGHGCPSVDGLRGCRWRVCRYWSERLGCDSVGHTGDVVDLARNSRFRCFRSTAQRAPVLDSKCLSRRVQPGIQRDSLFVKTRARH